MMEHELFTFENFEGGDDLYSFYDVVLIQRVGDYPVGTKFGSACVDYSTGTLQLCKEKDGLTVEYKLHLKVGEKTWPGT
jgi:hypothetical protein